MNPGEHDVRLSPISRRAFFKRLGQGAVALGSLGALSIMGACPSVPVGNCGYCNGTGRDYYHCDGDYCDYINYVDVGYSDSSCGYCNGCGRNYYHCDGNYCDYINYADGC